MEIMTTGNNLWHTLVGYDSSRQVWNALTALDENDLRAVVMATIIRYQEAALGDTPGDLERWVRP